MILFNSSRQKDMREKQILLGSVSLSYSLLFICFLEFLREMSACIKYLQPLNTRGTLSEHVQVVDQGITFSLTV